MSVKYIDKFSGYFTNRNPLLDPDGSMDGSLIAGSNLIHTERGTYQRRPGLSRWSTVALGGTSIPITAFAYNDGVNHHVIVDDQLHIREYTPTSSSALLTKGGSGNQTSFAAVRDTLYMTSNITGGVKHKKIGNSAIKEWGIEKPTVAPSWSVGSGGGGIATTLGWRYRYVYEDSTDGHLSSASPPSTSTGERSNDSLNVTVTGTNQNRVDKIQIFRTKDGGSTYFYLTTISNPGATTAVYNDSTDDALLNIFLICPTETSNDPPPDGMTDLVRHNFRLVGIHGNDVRMNLNRADAYLNGVEEECWPPELTFRFNNPVALVSTLDGLLVFTSEGTVYIITGSTIQDFDPSEIFSNLPVACKNCVTRDGNSVFVYTANRELLEIGDSFEVLSRGLSAEDLADFTPASSYLTVHRQDVRSSVYLVNNNNKLLVYNKLTNTWSPPWTVDGTIVSYGMVISLKTSVSESNLLIAPQVGQSGYLWKLDSNIKTDDSTPFTCFGQFGSFVISNFGDLFSLKAIFTEASDSPTVSVLLREVSGAPSGTMTVVAEPPRLATATTLSSLKHYLQRSDFPLECRHFQVRLTWPADETKAELYALGFEDSREN